METGVAFTKINDSTTSDTSSDCTLAESQIPTSDDEDKNEDFSETLKQFEVGLSSLITNDKKILDVLTKLAGANLKIASQIADIIIKNKYSVDGLLILYLVDSITKNVGQAYIAVFSTFLVSIFKKTFIQLDDIKKKEKMFSLRYYWNNVFPEPLLTSLDVVIHQIEIGQFLMNDTINDISNVEQYEEERKEPLEKADLELFDAIYDSTMLKGILERTNLDLYGKLKLYNQEHKRFLFLHRESYPRGGKIDTASPPVVKIEENTSQEIGTPIVDTGSDLGAVDDYISDPLMASGPLALSTPKKQLENSFPSKSENIATPLTAPKKFASSIDNHTRHYIESKGTSPVPLKWLRVVITPGFYSTVEEIIHALNEQIMWKTKLKDFFHFDTKSKRVGIKGGNKVSEGSTIVISFKAQGRLALQLGCQPGIELSASSKPPYVANVASGVPTLMLIYCDVVEPQITGDSCSKLLRTVNTANGILSYFARPYSTEFTQQHYIPLQKKYFDSIRIDIRDVTEKVEQDMLYQYYLNQAGSGIGDFYSGPIYQRGYGIGSFLGGLFKTVLPILKRAGVATGREILKNGTNFLNDVENNVSPRSAFSNRAKETVENLKRKVMYGEGFKAMPANSKRQLGLKPRKKIMTSINRATALNVKSELDIFSKLPIQTTVESGTLQSYRPITSISNDGPIEFLVSGCSSDEYLDLGRVYIYVKARLNTITPPVVHGVPAQAAGILGPTNNWLHSTFSQVDVYLNQKCITPPSNCYPYRAYIENLLNYSSESKKTHLTSGVWADDTAGHMDAVTNDNAGFKTRRALTKDNKDVEMYGPLHCDLFNVDKYLLSGVDMAIKLQRADQSFHIMGTSDAQGTFELKDAVLYVRKVKIAPGTLLAHHKVLSSTTAKYPINRVDIRT
ncbi:Pre-mRNA cleavage complex 2 protein Pcf11, partial [Pseudolycoriella hygida]